MLADSDWVVLGEPATPAEANALVRFRELLPDDGLTRAWVNLTFVDHGGRTGEIDVLLLTRAGFFVVELKGWHGRITGDDQRWTLAGNSTRTVVNPYLATDSKAKRLSSLLKEHAPNEDARRHMPFLGSLVVLHGEDSRVDLAERGSEAVVALDGYRVKGVGKRLPLLSERLATPPRPEGRSVVDVRSATNVKRACERASFRPTPRTRYIGQFPLDETDPVAEGPDWQDFVAEHPVLHQPFRLRLFDLAAGSSADERERVEQQARRELRLTQGLAHEGITAPLDIFATDSGPALVFPHPSDEVPLLDHLADHAGDLTLDQRMALVRQLGEALTYAHERRLVHRALAPEHVWVRPGERGPRLAVRDWYTGQKSRSSVRGELTTISAGITDVRAVVSQASWLYLAPEALEGSHDLPSIPLDVYGFGALACLVLSGRPPASNIVELTEMLQTQGCLDPSVRTSDLPDDLAQALREATARVEPERTSTVAEVMAAVEQAWQDARRQDADEQVSAADPRLDPAQAQPGDVIAERFIVTARRGEGSTGVALLVQDADGEDEREHVLKLGISESAERRLGAEAETLRVLGRNPRVVRLVEGPLTVDGRTALLLSDAGKDTLAARLSAEGRATIGQLEQFGADLLEAVAHVHARGVFHRDVKPANLGIAPDPATYRPRLTLFDLSLSREPVDDIASGTQGYLDPYLGRGRRRRFDSAAELWSVSATLFEMATGEQPWWEDGGRGPGTSDEAPVVEPASFEASVRSPLTAFFTRALAPEVADRFPDVDEMTVAWHDTFGELDTAGDGGGRDEAAAEAAGPATILELSGLSARALSGLSRLDVHTVGDLLAVPPFRVNKIPGLGERYRKEISAQVRTWRERLGQPDTAPEAVSRGRAVESSVAALVGKVAEGARPVVRAVLGLADGDLAQNRWPLAGEVAAATGVGRAGVVSAVDEAVDRWSRAKVLQGFAEVVVGILASSGRVMTVEQVATALAANQGSTLDAAERLKQGTALLRAVVEVDSRSEEPCLAVRRRSSASSLLALTEAAAPAEDGASAHADALFELAVEVGDAADALVQRGVVPGADAVQHLHAALPETFGGTDDQLVRLAATASKHALVSGLGGLYPRTLSVADALEHALRGRPGRPLTIEWVHRRLRARFPELPVDLPPRPALDDLVDQAVPGLRWDGAQYALLGTASASAPARSLTRVATQEPHLVRRLLQQSLQRCSALTLCIPPRLHEQVVSALREDHGVRVVDVSRVAVDAARGLAAQRGIRWEVALDADADERTSRGWGHLTRLMHDGLRPEWDRLMASPAPLLLTGVGVLARYGLTSWLSDLLDVATSRPAARWVLVPRDSSRPVPLISGQPVPMGPGKWIDLPHEMAHPGQSAGTPLMPPRAPAPDVGALA